MNVCTRSCVRAVAVCGNSVCEYGEECGTASCGSAGECASDCPRTSVACPNRCSGHGSCQSATGALFTLVFVLHVCVCVTGVMPHSMRLQSGFWFSGKLLWPPSWGFAWVYVCTHWQPCSPTIPDSLPLTASHHTIPCAPYRPYTHSRASVVNSKCIDHAQRAADAANILRLVLYGTTGV